MLINLITILILIFFIITTGSIIKITIQMGGSLVYNDFTMMKEKDNYINRYLNLCSTIYYNGAAILLKNNIAAPQKYKYI